MLLRTTLLLLLLLPAAACEYYPGSRREAFIPRMPNMMLLAEKIEAYPEVGSVEHTVEPNKIANNTHKIDYTLTDGFPIHIRVGMKKEKGSTGIQFNQYFKTMNREEAARAATVARKVEVDASELIDTPFYRYIESHYVLCPIPESELKPSSLYYSN